MELTENFSATQIKEQLSSILSSTQFKSSAILSGFLEFIVAEILAGRGRDIKEYTIGVNVLSRNSDFNPQLDAIVRIHAGRLRRALKEYYSESGKSDLIYIEIPKGSYVPVFRSPDKIQRQEKTNGIKPDQGKPVVAVLPFRNISKDASRDFFADGLGEQLSNDLTLFNDLSVISYYSSRCVADKTHDLNEAVLMLGARYVLTGSIQNDIEHLRISVQLISGDRGEQIWSKSYERSNTATGLFDIQKEIVKSVLSAVGGYFGAILKDVIKAPYGQHSNGIEVYDAIFWYYHYQKVFTTEAYQQAVHALEAALKADPQYALAWAVLGELYLDDRALEFTKAEQQLETGIKYALRAATIDPNCQHAYQTLAWAYLILRDKEECLKSIDKCLSINPNASNVVGTMGFGLVCAGEFEQGMELLKDSMTHNAFSPWYFYFAISLYYLDKKEYKEALVWADKMNMPGLLWDPLLKAAILAHKNRMEEAGKNITLLLQLVPDAGKQAKDLVSLFLLTQDLIDHILDGLIKAGLNVE